MHRFVYAYTCVDMHMYIGMFASTLGMQDLIIRQTDGHICGSWYWALEIQCSLSDLGESRMC